MEPGIQAGAVLNVAGLWDGASVRFRDLLSVRLPDFRDRAVMAQDIAPFGHFATVRVHKPVIVQVLQLIALVLEKGELGA
jgi:hypothetical protein